MDHVANRGYQQACAIAASLDLLGQRWTLLIVRDLLIGPRRYTDLLNGLPGIGTNLLAERLKSLTEAGVIEQETLPAPAATRVYRLTEMGRELELPLVELCRWGLRYGFSPAGETTHDSRWTVLALRAAFQPALAKGIELSCEFRIGDNVFHARVADGQLTTGLGAGGEADLVLALGEEAFRDLASGAVELERLVSDGRATLEGDLGTYARFASVFSIEDVTADPATT